jgi:hypothetical protein
VARHHLAKLTPEIVWEIRDIYKMNTHDGKINQGLMQDWLARKFNLPVGTIRKIIHNTTWKRPYVGMTWAEWEKENGRSST